jgi:hypothetical protein
MIARRPRRRADHEYTSRSPWRLALAGAVTALVVSAVGIVSPLGSAASPSGWYVATTPATGADDVLLGSSCPNALQCFAAGISIQNINSNGTFSPLAETWNGTTWTLAAPPPLPPGRGGGLFNVSCVTGSDCWAVGAVQDASGNGNPTGSLIENWNGSAWSVVPSPTPTGPGVVGAVLQGVSCISASSCFAVGYTSDQNGENLNAFIEQWNGGAWNIVPGATTGQTFDQLSTVQCLATNNCWAVGNAGPAQQNPNFLPIFPGAAGDQGLIEHWDGTSWSVTPSATYPSPSGGYLSGLGCAAASDCWASGATTDSSGHPAGVLMEHWNGSGWTDVSASVPNSSTPGILSSISCLSSAQCWAAGSLGDFGGGGGGGFQPQGFIENWNGTSWSVDPSPNVAALSFLPTLTCVRAVVCVAAGSAATQASANDPGLRTLVEQMAFPPASNQGIVLGALDGGVFNYGTTQFRGSMGGQHLNAPVVGVAEMPDGGGYWLASSDGGVFAFGSARFYGSMGGQRLNRPIVGIAATPDGQGYWLVASDGGVFNYGDAQFHGSMGGQHLNAPVVGIASADDGGYWMAASDGGIFNFGDAAFFGSAGGTHLNRPVSGIAATPDGRGYWMTGSDGGIFNYGDAGFFGSVPGQGILGQPPVVGISGTPTGSGYWLVGTNGAVYTYGDAAFLGAPNASKLVAPVSGMASS